MEDIAVPRFWSRANGARADIQSVFDPVFNQILQLVQDQVNTVKALHKQKIQVPPDNPRPSELFPRTSMVLCFSGGGLFPVLSSA